MKVLSRLFYLAPFMNIPMLMLDQEEYSETDYRRWGISLILYDVVLVAALLVATWPRT